MKFGTCDREVHVNAVLQTCILSARGLIAFRLTLWNVRVVLMKFKMCESEVPRKCCNMLHKEFLTLLIFDKVLFIYYIQKFTEYIEGVGFVSIAGPVVLKGQQYAHLPSRIFRPAPRFCPACVAPLFCPACRPMMVSPALSCSSLKSRLHSSAGLGPK